MIKWLANPIMLLIAALAVVLVMMQCGDSDPDAPKIPPALQRSLDSADVTQSSFHARQDSLGRDAARDTLASATMNRLAASARRSALTARRLADSLARTEQAWRQAYDARSEEARLLDSTLTLKDSALTSERASRIKFQTLYREDSTRLHAITNMNVGLRDAIAHLERPCRIVAGIPCPDRRTSAVLSAALGYLAGKQ